MAGLRTTTHLNLLNAENESRIQNGKMAVAGARAGAVRSTRAAMAEIGNNQMAGAVSRGGLRAKDANAVIKPARMMTKQKGTTSLKALTSGPAPPKPLTPGNNEPGSASNPMTRTTPSRRPWRSTASLHCPRSMMLKWKRKSMPWWPQLSLASPPSIWQPSTLTTSIPKTWMILSWSCSMSTKSTSTCGLWKGRKPSKRSTSTDVLVS